MGVWEEGGHWGDMVMCCRHGSMRGYALSEYLEPGVQHSRATERRHVHSNRPSTSSPYSDDHMPSLPTPITLKLGRNIKQESYDVLMHCRHGSTRGYAHSEDLETGVRHSRATDCQADGATTRTLQPPL